MKTFMAILIGVLSLISCGVIASQNIILHGKYKISRDLYLTREAYYPPDYPCGLSKYEYVGKGSRIIKKVGTIPKGSIVTIERSHTKMDLYAPETIRVQGKVIFNGEWIGYNSDFTHDQFSKWFTKIE
jgi:hypothetical protein